MKKTLLVILTILFSLNAQALFEVKDASDHSVFEITNDGIRIFNYPDTLMIINSSEVRVNLDNTGKGLSRSFSISTSATGKSALTNVLEISTDSTLIGTPSTVMRSGGVGRYTEFTPENIFIGLNAGINATPGFPLSNDGDDNVFIGNNSGGNSTSGENNVFVGNSSGYTAEDINASIFIGVNAGYLQNVDHGNVYVGQSAGMYMESGGGNVFLGTVVACNQSSGSDNVIIGGGAATMVNEYGTHTGNNNVVLGADAGKALRGDNNVYIGYGAGYGYIDSNRLHIENSTSSPSLISGEFDNDRVGINDNAPSANLHIKQVGTGEEGLAIENDTDTDVWSWEIGANDLMMYFNGIKVGQWDDATGNYTAGSDKRLKKDIRTYDEEVLPNLLKLEMVDYRLKHANKNTQKILGFVAQDVKKLFPNIIRDREDEFLGLNYDDFGVLAIKAIQEQQEIINKQQKEITNLKSEIEEIKKFLNK